MLGQAPQRLGPPGARSPGAHEHTTAFIRLAACQEASTQAPQGVPGLLLPTAKFRALSMPTCSAGVFASVFIRACEIEDRPRIVRSLTEISLKQTELAFELVASVPTI